MSNPQYVSITPFSTDAARGRVENGRWILSGKMFEVGNYPDKKFSMTEAELTAAVSRFKPVKLNDNHDPKSFFSNKLGEVIKVEQKGGELHGEAAFPLWMKEAAGDEPIKLSCEWTQDTKDLAAVAVTMNPRVHDAALFACFSNEVKTGAITSETNPSISEDDFTTPEGKVLFSMAHVLFAKKKTYEGQSVLQSVHDQSARAGAVCNIKEGVTNFHTAAELNRIQEIHDLAVKGGAQCSSGDGKMSYRYFNESEQPDDTEAFLMTLPKDEEGLASFFKKHFPKVFGGESSDAGKSGDADTTTTTTATPAAAAATSFNNDPAMIARLQAAETSRIENTVSALIRDGHILPKLKDQVTADFNEQLELDSKYPETVKFNVTETDKEGQKKQVEKSGTRLDRRIAFYYSMPKHALTEEYVQPDADARVLLSDENPGQDIYSDVTKQAERIAEKYKPTAPLSGGTYSH